jgi:hypothetical protein
VPRREKAVGVSAARHAYGLPGVVEGDEQPRVMSAAVPLLLLCAALAVAAIWFVALPALSREPGATRSCEVIVLKGAPRCLEQPAVARMAAAKHKASKPKR